MTNPGPVQRAQERRRLERVENYQRQIREGSLKVRKMTKADWDEFGSVKDEKAARKRAKQKAVAEAKRRG